MKHPTKAALLAGLLMVLAAPSTQAQQAEPKPDYSPDEFVRAILSGPQPCPPGQALAACEANPKTRRFSLATPPTHTAASAPAGPTAMAVRRRVSASDILVTFDVDSAEITLAGSRNLESIAAALKKPALKPIQFEVAGYTDASGSPGHNVELSVRRAEAVRKALIALNVEPERLKVTGFGSEHLANPANPVADENRRVELHRLN
ncbi:MAG: OmpA family protein [Phenylobacterium sp.]